MAHLTLFLLACYGFAFGLMNDKIPGVSWAVAFLGGEASLAGRMLSCAYCTGFHVGWVLALLTGQGQLLVSGMASSAFCYAFDALVKRLERECECVGTVGEPTEP
jgi:fucose permease